MNDKGKRPRWTRPRTSARGSCDDRREMTASSSEVAPVRKKLRSVGSCTPTHIIDGFVRNPGVSELESNQRSEVTVRLRAFPPDDRSAFRGVFHLAGNLLTDFERIDSDVRTDRHDELGGVV